MLLKDLPPLTVFVDENFIWRVDGIGPPGLIEVVAIASKADNGHFQVIVDAEDKSLYSGSEVLVQINGVYFVARDMSGEL